MNSPPYISGIGRSISTSEKRFNLIWIVLFLGLNISVRLILTDVHVTPDSGFFKRLAQNIALNGCYSTSEVASAICKPSWGSQPPGYPVFLATLSYFSVHLFELAAILQILIFAGFSAYALHASYAWHRRKGPLLISGFVLCFSPASIGWSQWILTGTLASSAALWVFAEIFRSLSAKKFRTIGVALAALGAVSIRWDMVWLMIPALCTSLYLEGWKKGLVKLSISSVPAFVLILSLIIRAIVVGLPAIPGTLSDPSLPSGIMNYWKAGARTYSATTDFLWPLWGRRFGQIERNLDYESFHSDFRTDEFKALLKEIDKLPRGTPLPSNLDLELQQMAFRGKEGSNYSLPLLLLDRMWGMWSLSDTLHFTGWLPFLKSNPSRQQVESILQAYRLSLLILTAVACLFVRRSNLVLLGGLFLFILSRTFFLASLTMIEIRYLAPVIPSMELIVFTVLATLFSSRPIASEQKPKPTSE